MLFIEPLRADTFLPFGDVISVAESRHHFVINDGYAQRYHDIARVDVASANGFPIISIFRAQPRQFPLPLRLLERHPLGSQAFFPLGSQPFLVVVAPGDGQPNMKAIRCFIAQPGQGVNYARGVWHHPLIALGAESDFLVVDRAGAECDANCEEYSLLDFNISIQFPPKDLHEPHSA
jgi:ureidoglycolate lyase